MGILRSIYQEITYNKTLSGTNTNQVVKHIYHDIKIGKNEELNIPFDGADICGAKKYGDKYLILNQQGGDMCTINLETLEYMYNNIRHWDFSSAFVNHFSFFGLLSLHYKDIIL